MRRLVLGCLIVLFCLPALADVPAAPLRIGVMAFRTSAQAMSQWQPLAAYLEAALRRRVELTAYRRPDLEAAVAAKAVDVVLTNPSHYILLHDHYNLSAPLATQITLEGGYQLPIYGSVIFTRADQAAIDTLPDLAGKRFASTGVEALGSYQMQAFEMLEAGVPLPDLAHVLTPGTSHDLVVEAVLAGRADVGLIRSGVLEAMARERKFDFASVKIIGARKIPGFPFVTSTRLYPEWPVAVAQHIDEPTARRLAIALLSLPSDSAAARAAQIGGFAVPADYGNVENLLRRLRIAPFDAAPDFTLNDFAKKYLWPLTLALAVLALVFLTMGARLRRQNRDLVRSGEHLDFEHRQLRTLIRTLPDLVWLKDTQGVYRACNSRFEQFVGASEQDIVGKTDFDLFEPALAEFFIVHDQAAMQNNGTTVNEEPVTFGSDGHTEMLETTKMPMRDAQGRLIGVLGIGHDITERKQAESHLQLAASVFTHAREGIIITDAAGVMVRVNDTFSAITGYGREEALGRNPRMLKSELQTPESYAAMWKAIEQDGHWSGELWNRRKNGEVYAEMITISAVRDAAGQTQNYVALFTDVTPMKEHQRELDHIAHYDALTGLPNRVQLAERLEQAIAASRQGAQPLAVVYLDLDGFKQVNDEHGHHVGDKLLIAVARRMRASLRENNVLARIGGDEFVAVLVGLSRPDDYEAVLARLLQAAAEPVGVGELVLRVTASIGVTLYPHDGVDADLLIRHADQAMYLAKQAGKNRYCLFDVAQDAALADRHESMGRIHQALEHGEFVLYYQPKVNMKTGAVVGAEALIRWRHPERGLLPPAAFLPIIENHAISVELGEWVIATALAQMARWRRGGLRLPVSVNVGARQLQQGDFAQRLAALLAAEPTVAPADLELEILETSALEEIVQVSEVMHACLAMGVRFALDDFGTGYSSLSYLKRLPAQLLKIDQSFVRDMLDDPEDLAIIEGVMGLAAAFGRQVIAEGVETVAHGELLLPLGCELAQGYGIARPMPAEQMPRWAANWRPHPAWSLWRDRAISQDDLAEVFAEVQHRHWLGGLEAFLAGKRIAPPSLDEHDCHFGRWQQAVERGPYAGGPELEAAVDLHECIHAQARELVDRQLAGLACEAQLEQLHARHRELIATLRRLAHGADGAGQRRATAESAA
ncbi:MAG: EAL domain-containing protein [Burkholderiaceae bacterium]|nr:EAL domain-containing protein [Burkholderiaceae bacterium]